MKRTRFSEGQIIDSSLENNDSRPIHKPTDCFRHSGLVMLMAAKSRCGGAFFPGLRARTVARLFVSAIVSIPYFVKVLSWKT